uniref:Putative secreted protein n=1 Tax=Ixodes ricinus TaxID=34613 RepID=A0A6B0V2G1_IXORI
MWLACRAAREEAVSTPTVAALLLFPAPCGCCCCCCGCCEGDSICGAVEGPPSFSLRSAAARLSRYWAANWCLGSMRMCSMWCRSPDSCVKTLWHTVQGHMRIGDASDAISGWLLTCLRREPSFTYAFPHTGHAWVKDRRLPGSSGGCELLGTSPPLHMTLGVAAVVAAEDVCGSLWLARMCSIRASALTQILWQIGQDCDAAPPISAACCLDL